jgi:hypothetical protein
MECRLAGESLPHCLFLITDLTQTDVGLKSDHQGEKQIYGTALLLLEIKYFSSEIFPENFN